MRNFFILVATTNVLHFGWLIANSNGEKSLEFYLYRRNDPSTPQKMDPHDFETVEGSIFDKQLETKVIIHGWNDSYLKKPNKELIEAYFSQYDANIFSVDWSEYASNDYPAVVGVVPKVGLKIAEFLDFMKLKFDMNFKKLVVIGYSIGAQVAGFCGKNVKRGRIEAIVGLDPSAQSFGYFPANDRLNSTDAEYVMTIHTMLSYFRSIGTASFFPNWGNNQPGCDKTGFCSHERSVHILAKAIKKHKFQPFYFCNNRYAIRDKCCCSRRQDDVEIGDPMDIKRAYGTFFFTTQHDFKFDESKNLNSDLNTIM